MKQLPKKNCNYKYCPFMVGFKVRWIGEDDDKMEEAVYRMLKEMWKSGRRICELEKK